MEDLSTGLSKVGVLTLPDLGLQLGPVVFGLIGRLSGNRATGGYATIPITLLAALVAALVGALWFPGKNRV